MSILERGRLVARRAEGPADVAAALTLRSQCFRGGLCPDRDIFDDRCDHMLVEDRATGGLVCCYRTMAVAAANITQSYSGRYYDLSGLRRFPGAAMELGRFCMAPGATHDSDTLRIAWGALTRLVDRAGVGLLFGCSSFHGTDAGAYREVFALLAARHLAPEPWRPGVAAPRVIRFAETAGRPDLRRAMAGTPPLLRTYLAMGGWVSDHAVVDPDLDTLHVFTGLEIGKVPPARARLLRAIAG